jgi:CheY-like chemotaxis protein
MEGSMSKAIVLRTKSDGRLWLVSFDKPAVSEISHAALDGLGVSVTEVDTLPAATERAAAASFPMHVVQ